MEQYGRLDGSGSSNKYRIVSNLTNYKGGGQPHNHGLIGGVANGDNVPPFYALAFIIKL